jgi:hypothetical protein
VSVYSSGADAFRDTTKWLVSFVPIGALGTAAAVLGPLLVRSAQAAGSLSAWVGDNGWALGGVGGVLVGVLAVVWFGARVLSTQPKDYGALLTTNPTRLSKAFSAGVAAPYFLDDEGFKDALAKLEVKWRPDSTTPPADAEVTRAAAAVEALREWALQDELAAAFQRFQIFFAIGLALIVAGVVVAAVTINEQGASIEKPTTVQVSVNQPGAADLLKETGCTTPAQSQYVAVAGTWDAPVLQVNGPGCLFGNTWRPKTGDFEIHPLSGATVPYAGGHRRRRWGRAWSIRSADQRGRNGECGSAMSTTRASRQLPSSCCLADRSCPRTTPS